MGWVADSALTVELGGTAFPSLVQNLEQWAGPLELLTVNPSNGCVQSHEFVLPQPPPLNLYIEYEPALCSDDLAVAYAVGYGGTPGYLVNWNGLDPNDLPAGEVSITLNDAQGCVVDSTWVVEIPEVLAFEVTVVDEDAGNDGAIVVEVTGGSPPYEILWNTGLVGEFMLEGLSTGIYSWVISDANGCNVLGLQDIINVGIDALGSDMQWSLERTSAGLRLLAPGVPSEGKLHLFDGMGRQVLSTPLECGAQGHHLLPWSSIPARGFVLLLDGGGAPLLRAPY